MQQMRFSTGATSRIALVVVALGVTARGGPSHPARASSSAPPTATASSDAAAATPGVQGAAGGSGLAVAAAGAAGVLGYPVGPLQPTAVDGGQCQAGQFADNSVYAQIAIAHSTCGQVVTVATEADRARGKAYAAGGFSCTSTPEQPGDGYWYSAYYTYACVSGADQLAFNWGTSSRY